MIVSDDMIAPEVMTPCRRGLPGQGVICSSDKVTTKFLVVPLLFCINILII